nr:hypothetical protein [uncultured Psychroserpens sp.]
MRKLLVIIVFGITIQFHSQIQVELYFFDECNDKIEKLEFDLINLDNGKEFSYYESKGVVDSIGTYIVFF